jgi:hypothetical protein
MIRENHTAGSKHALMLVSPGSGLAFQFRAESGGNTSTTSATGAAPTWIRIARTGNVFTGYRSLDGINWVQVGTATISMGTDIYIGPAVTSHNNSVLCTAGFENVMVEE